MVRFANINKSMMVKNIWNFLVNKISIWVSGIMEKKKSWRFSFWGITKKSKDNYYWKSLISLRQEVNNLFTYKPRENNIFNLS